MLQENARSDWPVTWARVSYSLAQQLPPEALQSLRIAYRRHGANSVSEFFSLLNAENYFVGPSAKMNCELLLKVLAPWSNHDSVVELSQHVRFLPDTPEVLNPLIAPCVIVSPRHIKLLPDLFGNGNIHPTMWEGRLTEYRNALLYRCDENPSAVDYDRLMTLFPKARSTRAVRLIFVGPARGPQVLRRTAVVPLSHENELGEVYDIQREVVEELLPDAHANAAVMQISSKWYYIDRCVTQRIPSRDRNSDSLSWHYAQLSRRCGTVWIPLLHCAEVEREDPALLVYEVRLVSYLASNLTTSAVDTDSIVVRAIGGDESQDYVPAFLFWLGMSVLVRQTRGSVVFTFEAPLYVYWRCLLRFQRGDKWIGPLCITSISIAPAAEPSALAPVIALEPILASSFSPASSSSSPRQEWVAEWTKYTFALQAGLPHDCLPVLSKAFSISAPTLAEWLSAANKSHLFDGENAKKNVGTLLAVLKPWQNLQCVKDLAAAAKKVLSL